MATCGNCGAEGTRIRCRWKEGVQLPDECPHCAPQSFDKFKSVRDGQITLAHEYDHTRYRKLNGNFVLTDEGRADLEAAVSKQSEEERLKAESVIERKRQTRRTQPMTSAEIKQTIEHVNNILEPRQSSLVN